jgi:glutathione S-transferase
MGADLVLYAPAYASVPVIRCSPPSWMAHILLEAKGLEHRVAWLSFERGEHKTPEMLARNPRGTIPVLSDGEAAVHETFAILEYLELSCPGPAYLPAERRARATALTRLHESVYVKDAGMAAFRQLMRAGEGEKPGPALWAELDAELARFDAYLEGAAFVAGEAISLADLAVFTYVATAAQLGYELAKRPHVARHHAMMCERPAVRATWPATWPAT